MLKDRETSEVPSICSKLKAETREEEKMESQMIKIEIYVEGEGEPRCAGWG